MHGIQPSLLSAEEERKFDHHIRSTRGELLFARCWLLVEGEAERVLFAGTAEAAGINLERAGVRCVEYAQTNIVMLIKIAQQLGIDWYCVMDDDKGRRKYEKRVRKHVGDEAWDGLVSLPYTSPELLLCEHGFGDLYEDRMSSQKPQPLSRHGTPQYWREVLKALPDGYSKPAAALEAVLRMQDEKQKVPQTLLDILNRAVALAAISQ